jgi:hypothetical protein
MQERRGHMRDKVLLGAVAEIREIGSTVDCVVRNLSDNGACVEFKTSVNLPDQMKLMIKRKGRSYLTRMVWQRANRVGLAFSTMVTDPPADDLDARLRRSEKKKRELQRRIDELLGSD